MGINTKDACNAITIRPLGEGLQDNLVVIQNFFEELRRLVRN